MSLIANLDVNIRAKTGEFDGPIGSSAGKVGGFAQAVESAGQTIEGRFRGLVERVGAVGVAIATVGAAVLAVGAAITGGIVAAVKTFADHGAELLRLSHTTGVTVEALSTLQFAFGKVGVEAESLTTGLVHMQAFLSEAINGGKEAREKLLRLGLSLDVLRRVPSDEKFRIIADALSRVADETERVAAARAIFGRGGTDLLPGIDLGAAGIRQLEEDMRRLGLVMTGESARMSREFLKSLNALTGGFKGVWFQVSQALLPILSELVAPLKTIRDQMLLGGRAAALWISANRELVATVLKVGFGAVAVGTALVAAGAAVKGVSLALGLLSPFVAGAGVALSGLGRVGGRALLFLTTPLGLVTALGVALTTMGGGATIAGLGILGMVVAIKLVPVACAVASAAMAGLSVVTAIFTGGLSLVPTLIAAGSVALIAFGVYMAYVNATSKESADAFARWKAIAVDAFGAIKAAVLGGRIDLAFAVVTAGLNLAWVEVIGFMRVKWQEFLNWWPATMEGAAKAVARALVEATAAGLRAVQQLTGQDTTALDARERGLLAQIDRRAGAWQAARDRALQQLQAGIAVDVNAARAALNAAMAAANAVAPAAAGAGGGGGQGGGGAERKPLEFAERGSVKAFEIINKVQGDRVYAVQNRTLQENQAMRRLLERIAQDFARAPVVARANI
jgi:hypothetical protein